MSDCVNRAKPASTNEPSLESNKGRIQVKGTAGTNASHTVNEDERTSFTEHINGVSGILNDGEDIY